MAAAAGASFFPSGFSNSTHRLTSSSRPHLHFLRSTRHSDLSLVWQSSFPDTNPTAIVNVKHTEIGCSTGATLFMEEEPEESLNVFFELAESLFRSDNGVGPPRWFSPLGCSSRLSDNCPLLLYLPGQSCNSN